MPIGSPGAKNKTTQQLREAFLKVFQLMGDDKGLHKWAKKHQSEFYKMASGIIPKELAIEDKRESKLPYEPAIGTDRQRRNADVPEQCPDDPKVPRLQ